MELESQVQEAEMLNQTLTAAYQELRAEIDRLEAEKAQEQYYGGFPGQPAASMDPSYAAPGSSTAGPGQGDAGVWGENAWIPEEWEPEDNYGGQ